MQPDSSLPYSFTPIAAGPDWITATAKAGSASFEFEELADRLLQTRRDAGGAIHPASLFGYQGHRSERMFFGRRSEDVMLQVSGPDATHYCREIIAASSNVSRLDLQVTVWTHGETPHLAVESYNYLRRNRRLTHRAGQLTVIQSDPKGETLYVNKRTSDSYGRLYDKATESKAGEARTLWRYEVEFKRRAAAAYARALLHSTCVGADTRDRVRAWWATKGIVPSFAPSSSRPIADVQIDRPTPDLLTWFEDRVSVTVARAIRRHGLKATISALKLDALVAPIEEEVIRYER